MAIYRYDQYKPVIAEGCYISDSARVIGDVVMGENCYVGHGAIVRADHGKIVLGRGTAVEENVVIHTRWKQECVLEERVTLGHGAIVHCDFLGANSVVGMGAVVGRECRIGVWAIVAEGCVVPRGYQVEDETLVAGVPAKPIGRVSQANQEYWQWAKDVYERFAQEYEQKLFRLD
ncbi:MAG: gamma carbonic anhydrase family protein [Proteobacteria bacterium]|nr:gamma carbonic anhydrase family protein [Pseudomonadota bacterium]MBU4574911.1 gamma carbonic anhydrase family protein [Pseudomonadota bacterium]MBU4597101.1 gamma carbonic anhydrase family protein [Pseudomonadota bacterium]MBV1715343.1 gamma carbonic anhydrase family protein [Desulfarculus sp.]